MCYHFSKSRIVVMAGIRFTENRNKNESCQAGEDSAVMKPEGGKQPDAPGTCCEPGSDDD